MEITLEIILDWNLFPDSFYYKWAEEIGRTESCDHGVIIEVVAEYTPGCPGRYDGHPDNMYPAEDPEVEICMTMISVRRAPYAMDRDLDDNFLALCHQFATDWLDVEAGQVEERLLELGKSTHQNEIAEILFDLEAAADAERVRRIEDRYIDGAAADWAASRTNAPDEK